MNIGDTSDEEMLDDTGPGPMIQVKQEIIDEYFTGLTNHDSDDDDDFPSEVIIHESDDSEEDNNDDCDADQIKRQHIYEQHEKNRNRKQVSEVDSQIKTEPDDTEDTGDQGIHHTSLETIGGSRGACQVDAPPMEPNSFIFTYIFAKKHPCRRSMSLLMGPHHLTGNPGSATGNWRFISTFIYRRCRRTFHNSFQRRSSRGWCISTKQRGQRVMTN